MREPLSRPIIVKIERIYKKCRINIIAMHILGNIRKIDNIGMIGKLVEMVKVYIFVILRKISTFHITAVWLCVQLKESFKCESFGYI